MNREEKNQITRGKILSSAMTEFAAHGYEAASLNTVCAAGGISKGIIYHYFDSKDGLYLACLRECFDTLTEYLKRHISEETRQEDLLTDYFQIRMNFFQAHPEYARLFCGAVVFPPDHLRGEILRIRQEFDALNDHYLTRILQNRRLRNDLSRDEIVRAFRMFQDSLNASYQNREELKKPEGTAADAENTEAETDIAVHEKDCRNLVQIFLYGILERN